MHISRTLQQRGARGDTGSRAGAERPGFLTRQWLDAIDALADPIGVNLRVERIWWELYEYSDQAYPVLPTQQYTMGRALPNGVIVLDIAVAANEYEEVTAFWMAHEYAHQILRHPQLSLSRLGQIMVASAGTAHEDAADRWAGRFLARYDYDAEEVMRFLCGLPGGGAGAAHSIGSVRARNVARSFGMSSIPTCRQLNDDIVDQGQTFRECMQERVDMCIESCQFDWGHPFVRCVSLCNPRSPTNRRVWEPICRDDGGSLLSGELCSQERRSAFQLTSLAIS